jgi:hypothetical protein
MNTTNTCRLIGSAAGLGMIAAAFLPWHGPIQSVNFFLGLCVYSTNELFGFDYIPIVGGALYLVFLPLAHRNPVWKALGAAAGGVVVLFTAYTCLRFRHADLLIGIKLTQVASIVATAVILPIRPGNRPGAAPAPGPSG